MAFGLVKAMTSEELEAYNEEFKRIAEAFGGNKPIVPLGNGERVPVKKVALDQTLRDTNKLLCIIADTLLDILATIDGGKDDETIAKRMFYVMDQRAKLGMEGIE